jgi:hypothetical protein
MLRKGCSRPPIATGDHVMELQLDFYCYSKFLQISSSFTRAAVKLTKLLGNTLMRKKLATFCSLHFARGGLEPGKQNSNCPTWLSPSAILVGTISPFSLLGTPWYLNLTKKILPVIAFKEYFPLAAQLLVSYSRLFHTVDMFLQIIIEEPGSVQLELSAQ